MLIPFPIGLFAVSLIFDLVTIGGGSPQLGFAAFWCILGGIAVGLVAAAFGLVDWRAIAPGTRAKRVGLFHAGANVIVISLFFLSWITRTGRYDHAPLWSNAILEIFGVGVLLVAGWLGGELVDHLGVGVAEGAHANAPSSLQTRHAHTRHG
jgi:uncharacterized membrane protein